MKYTIDNLEEYFRQYRKSIKTPRKFWGKIAEHFTWFHKWDSVLSYDMIEAKFSWFEGAKLNITVNAIDRHLKHNSEKTALLFEANDPNEASQHITYEEFSKARVFEKETAFASTFL
jgi:acetyl-CoA synthetase